MMVILPITLTQDNLGQRHHQFNTFVHKAFENRVLFESIRHVEEKSPIDRLFKIKYASKLRNVDYILESLKDKDMLYVSVALKCKWLLEYEFQDMMCPEYLEHAIYPDMITTAVSKMKNWLYIHLKDAERCENFFTYYCKTRFEYAIKFLYRCSQNFIMNEIPKLIEKLSPHHFKRLCETCPYVAKVYFDSIALNSQVKSNFLEKHADYYNGLKVLLKSNPEIFFKISEKYYKIKFNPSLTKYILRNHRDKYRNKLELYASSLLDIKTLADCLSPDECKETTLSLARADYLQYWFSYKTIEPLIKRLSVEERAVFKKRVFEQKDIGEMITEWPYDIPTLPTREYPENHIFLDPTTREWITDFDDVLDDESRIGYRCAFKSMQCFSGNIRLKTYLDKLFDEYRFVGFSKTFFELKRRMRVESSLQNREYILLVLVSKCGGHADNLASLLALLSQHSNEPVHLRAAVVRSLVKRAAVWRLPQDTWKAFLQFAQGLGLDGNTPEANCNEGLHAVVLRSLITTGDCERTVRDAFLRQCSDFKEYSINAFEKNIISKQLPLLILNAEETETDPAVKARYLTLLLDTLLTYKINIETTNFITSVATLEKSDPSAAKDILQRLFDLKIARRTLFRENFNLIQNNASYMNALRHDTSLLDINTFVDLLEKGGQRMDQALRKITIYFTEKFGLLEYCLTEIRRRVLEKSDVKLTIARPLCLLQGSDLEFIRAIDPSTKHKARLRAALSANMHAGRVKLDLSAIELRAVGAKGCANLALVCPKTQVDNNVTELLKWKRTVRIAIVLAERTGKEADSFATAVTLRPTATLKAAMKYFRRKGDSFEPLVWDAVKQTFKSVDYSTDQRKRLRNLVCHVKYIPTRVRAEFCALLYSALKDHFQTEALRILYKIENCISNVPDGFIEKIILEFFDKTNTNDNMDYVATCFYFRIFVKYVLISKTESIQNARLDVLAEPFFNVLHKLLNTPDSDFSVKFEKILRSLQSNEVFFEITYVSPLPFIEKILSWMRKHLPIEAHFNKYVYIHLTMLYFKAVRYSIVKNPDVFTDDKRKLDEGVDVVGHVFGVSIAREVKEIIAKYFESVTEIYQKGLVDYFNNYFNFGPSTTRFRMTVIKSLIESAVGSETKLAVYLLRNSMYDIDEKTKLEIIDKIKNTGNVESMFFLFAEIYDN